MRFVMTKEQFKKKCANFWYYYKIHTIVAVIAIICVAFTVKQCASRVSPDMTVIIATKTANLSDDQLSSIETMLSKYTADVNGDGKKVVSVENFYVGDDQNDKISYTIQAKLIASISSDKDSAIYIIDDSYYQQMQSTGITFYNLKQFDSSAPDSDRLSIEKLNDFNIKGLGSMLDSQTLCVRSFDSSSYDKSKNTDMYNNSIDVLKKLLKNSK